MILSGEKGSGVWNVEFLSEQDMIRINVTLSVGAGVRAEVAALLSEMADLSRGERGCIGYEILENCRLEDTMMIIETWENEAVLATHKESGHFMRIIPRVRELATEMKSQKFTTMASADEAITGRRTVREYTGEKICTGVIERVVRAGMYAPSVKDRRPWEFFVMEDAKHLHELAEILPGSEALRTAPMAILVCCNTRLAGLEGGNWPQELGACVQNMLLQAYAEGLGTAWIGVYPKMHFVHEVKKALHLSSEFVPFAVVAIGKTARETDTVTERYDPLKVHFISR
ncbi:nitroreductase family protein [Butyricimonas hominis]|uniref:nitroreductase family protein n=1 Tax=Butyricimonas TaxID=574697 RepID=UPI0035159052